jgi:hypothetical protein
VSFPKEDVPLYLLVSRNGNRVDDSRRKSKLESELDEMRFASKKDEEDRYFYFIISNELYLHEG